MISKEMILAPLSNLSRTLIGFILFALSELFIPPLFALGYIIRIYQNAENGDIELPEWQDWVRLGVLGIFTAIIMFLYLIPTLAALLLGIIFFTLQINVLGFLFVILAILLFALYVVILPAILYQFSKKENILDAFNFIEIFRLIVDNFVGHFTNLMMLFFINLPFFLLGILLKLILGKGLVSDIIVAILFAFYQFFILSILGLSFGWLYSGQKEIKQKSPIKPEKTPEVESETKKPGSGKIIEKGVKSEQLKFCSNCGAKITKKGAFCSSCGIKL